MKKEKHINIDLPNDPIKILRGLPGEDGKSMTGAQGIPGERGVQGEQGRDGPKGDRGDVGQQGDSGSDGKNGLDIDPNVLDSVTVQINQNTLHRDDDDKHFDNKEQKESVIRKVDSIEEDVAIWRGSAHAHANYNKLANYSHSEMADLDNDDHLQYLLLAGRNGQTINDDVEIDGDLTTTAGRIKNTTRYTTTQTILITDDIVFANTDGNAWTATLPTGVEGQTFKIVNSGSSGNLLTVAPNGAEHLLGVNSNFILFDGESLFITYNSEDGWY